MEARKSETDTTAIPFLGPGPLPADRTGSKKVVWRRGHALTEHTALAYARLRWFRTLNGIRPGISILLKEGLKYASGIKVLDLEDSLFDIAAEGVKQFLHAAQNTLPALRRIELNGNKFMEDDGNVEVLQELLENRKEAHAKRMI